MEKTILEKSVVDEAVGERFRLIVSHERLNLSSFAREIGFTPAGLNNIANNKNTASWDLLVRIAERFPHINMNWLVSGRGDMLNPKEGEITKAMLEQKLDSLNRQLFDMQKAVASLKS